MEILLSRSLPNRVTLLTSHATLQSSIALSKQNIALFSQSLTKECYRIIVKIKPHTFYSLNATKFYRIKVEIKYYIFSHFLPDLTPLKHCLFISFISIPSGTGSLIDTE